MRFLLCAAAAVALLADGGRAAILRVPEDRPTITAALAVAAAGDVISVAAGTYSASTGESLPLRFAGNPVVVEGVASEQCVLDGEGEWRLLEFTDGDASIVRGLSLVRGRTSGAGGAILIRDASPEIARVRFRGNRADGGGDAIAVETGAPVVRNCLFAGNRGEESTILVERGAPVIEFCTLHANGGAGLVVGAEADLTLRVSVVSRPGRGGGASIGLLLRGDTETAGWPALERNLFAECRDGVHRVDDRSPDEILAALDEAARRDGLRAGEPLDEALRPRGFDAYEIGAFAGPDPMESPPAEAPAVEEPERLLGPSVPNPFHPSTTIHFVVPDPSVVDLGVYNVLGQRVRTLLAGDLPAGEHTATWDGHDDAGVEAPPGIYFVRITQGRRPPESRRLVLVR